MAHLDVPSPAARTCLTCGETYPPTLEHWPFDALGRGGMRPHCLTCFNSARRRRYAENPEPTRQRVRRRRAERTTHFRQALDLRGHGPSLFPDTED